jgi:hypothetical protein
MTKIGTWSLLLLLVVISLGVLLWHRLRLKEGLNGGDGSVDPILDVGLGISGLGGAQITRLSYTQEDAVIPVSAPQTSMLDGGDDEAGGWASGYTGWSGAAGGKQTFVKGGTELASTIGHYEISGYGTPETVNGIDDEGVTEVSSDVTPPEDLPDDGTEVPQINVRAFTNAGGGSRQISNGETDIPMTMVVFQVLVSPDSTDLLTNRIVVQNPPGVRVDSLAWFWTAEGVWQAESTLVPGEVTIQVPKSAAEPRALATKTLTFSVNCPPETFVSAGGQCRQYTQCGDKPKVSDEPDAACCPAIEDIEWPSGGTHVAADYAWVGSVGCELACLAPDKYMNNAGECVSRVPQPVDNHYYVIRSSGGGSVDVPENGRIASNDITGGAVWASAECKTTTACGDPDTMYLDDCSGPNVGVCRRYQSCPTNGRKIAGGVLTDVSCCPTISSIPNMVYDASALDVSGLNPSCKVTCDWGWRITGANGSDVSCSSWIPSVRQGDTEVWYGPEPTEADPRGYTRGDARVTAGADRLGFDTVAAGSPFGWASCGSCADVDNTVRVGCSGWNEGSCETCRKPTHSAFTGTNCGWGCSTGWYQSAPGPYAGTDCYECPGPPEHARSTTSGISIAQAFNLDTAADSCGYYACDDGFHADGRTCEECAAPPDRFDYQDGTAWRARSVAPDSNGCRLYECGDGHGISGLSVGATVEEISTAVIAGGCTSCTAPTEGIGSMYREVTAVDGACPTYECSYNWVTSATGASTDPPTCECPIGHWIDPNDSNTCSPCDEAPACDPSGTIPRRRINCGTPTGSQGTCEPISAILGIGDRLYSDPDPEADTDQRQTVEKNEYRLTLGDLGYGRGLGLITPEGRLVWAIRTDISGALTVQLVSEGNNTVKLMFRIGAKSISLCKWSDLSDTSSWALDMVSQTDAIAEGLPKLEQFSLGHDKGGNLRSSLGDVGGGLRMPLVLRNTSNTVKPWNDASSMAVLAGPPLSLELCPLGFCAGQTFSFFGVITASGNGCNTLPLGAAAATYEQVSSLTAPSERLAGLNPPCSFIRFAPRYFMGFMPLPNVLNGCTEQWVTSGTEAYRYSGGCGTQKDQNVFVIYTLPAGELSINTKIALGKSAELGDIPSASANELLPALGGGWSWSSSLLLWRADSTGSAVSCSGWPPPAAAI